MTKNLVRLSDLLSHPFYICLDKELRNEIITKALEIQKDFKHIAEIVRCHPDTLRNFRSYHEVALSAIPLKNLLNLVGMTPIDVEQQVVFLRRGCSNRGVKIRLPIKPTSGLALLLAKTCGDGSILSDWRFHYTNNQKNLIEEVIQAVEGSIGETRPTLHARRRPNLTFEVKLSPVIGFILHSIGAPKGYKMSQSYGVPDWIMTGSPEVKAAFLRGLFDDEATVCNALRTRRIVLCLGKKQQHQSSLEHFLQQVRMLLFDFGIQSNHLRVQAIYNDKLMMELAIYRKDNFEKFQKYIGFSHQRKIKTLDEAICSYQNIHETREKVLGTVYNSSHSLTTNEIAEINKISTNLTKSHLQNLYREGIIRKTKSYRNLWSL